ncbi:fibrohexamerin-like [Maniola jurtina]|uniref:fibrohexamerin-like n=1 Tax=Maniola jurtina TaxID=191418 RepID=UPI001E68A219|nr:fibrohexamerin-like [Maniola jurtina]
MLTKTILLLAVTACAAVPSSIVRPCTTISCVARTLAAQSTCNPNVQGFVPSAYTIKKFRFDTPYFNSTYIDNDLVIRNHDQCFISEFYINVETNMLVLGLDCPALEFESTRTVIQHNSLQEDVVFDYTYQGIYPLIRLTTTMSLDEPLDMCCAFTFADVTALPHYRINPNDRQTAEYLSKDDTFLNIYERETFYCRASQLLHYFVNSVICDFGCDF